jgi:hypothetical protein
MQPEF